MCSLPVDLLSCMIDATSTIHARRNQRWFSLLMMTMLLHLADVFLIKYNLVAAEDVSVSFACGTNRSFIMDDLFESILNILLCLAFARVDDLKGNILGQGVRNVGGVQVENLTLDRHVDAAGWAARGGTGVVWDLHPPLGSQPPGSRGLRSQDPGHHQHGANLLWRALPGPSKGMSINSNMQERAVSRNTQ